MLPVEITRNNGLINQLFNVLKRYPKGTRIISIKTDRHDIAEILLKVALNTITSNLFQGRKQMNFQTCNVIGVF